jgi:hypothetical protein
MGKAFEITVWKPHNGMWADAMRNIKEVAGIFKDAGVSEVQILEGSIGKDVGNIMVIQTYKGLADNGNLNEKLASHAGFQDWMKEHGKDNFGVLVSHDLYVES